MKIEGAQCIVCGDFIYPRAKNDMISCSCGSILVEMGNKVYLHGEGLFQQRDIDTTPEELYNDFSTGENEFGVESD